MKILAFIHECNSIKMIIYWERGENIDDLFQIGCVLLIKAIDNFNMTQDVQFSTYGVSMIMC